MLSDTQWWEKSPFYDCLIIQYLSVTNEEFFKIWETLKCDFRLSPQVIIASDGRAGFVSSVFPKVRTSFFFWKRPYF